MYNFFNTSFFAAARQYFVVVFADRLPRLLLFTYILIKI